MGAEQSQLESIIATTTTTKTVGFFINGKEHNVNIKNINPNSLLVDYIRNDAGLTGTKFSCREGGCGACVVSVKSKDPSTGSDVIRAVNSCLTPVMSADGWEITTVEGLGNKKDGYHQLQKQVVQFSATQCGFCTPGMVMNMYSLTQSKPSFKSLDVEDSFDGNMCRCTGYRPIMDAFKSLASDASEELKRKCGHSCSTCPTRISCHLEATPADIEDFVKCTSSAYFKLQSGEEWVKATNLETAYAALQRFSTSGVKYRIVGGNTGTGVFKDDGPYGGFLDINNVPELKESVIDASGVKLGANVTLSRAIDLLHSASLLEGYSYTAQMSKHLKRVANVPVRNIGTLAGNLMMKHAHRDFPSDIFMLLETVGAKLIIGSSPSVSKEYTLLEFRDLNMNGKLIVSIQLPAYNNGSGVTYIFRSYKITRRYQNAHAYVNGGILLKLDRNRTLLEKPRIVFGGIHPDFVHATRTEETLVGKILDKSTLITAMNTLGQELQPDDKATDANPMYRKTLAQSLLYKTILGVLGTTVKSPLKSGAEDLEHSPTKGSQSYERNTSEYPLYEPIPKLEALVQASGEAQYINDIEPEFGELQGAFVVSSVGPATLQNVDASEALIMPGVVAFIQAKDVPGLNNYTIAYAAAEEIFASRQIQFAGQSIGLILAETRQAALNAREKVKISYSDLKKPIVDIKDAIRTSLELGDQDHVLKIERSDPVEVEESRKVRDPYVIKGEFRIGSQYHMTMETQTCICIPREDGMDVLSSTQFVDGVVATVSTACGIPNHNVNVKVRRLGGGYGAKISKATHIAVAAAVGATVTNRPVRIVLDLETNMKMIGKRLPYLTNYEANVDDHGVILSMKGTIFCDPGCNANEATSLFALINMQNAYRASGWTITAGRALTDTPSNTYCRAPGTTQGIATIEAIMEHIAHVLGKNPEDVRTANLIKDGDALFGIPGKNFKGENPIPKMLVDLKASCDYEQRKNFIDTFNNTNRYRKRGICLMPVRYPLHYPNFAVRFPVYISVYHVDGTVAVSHGGIEMGQGINTKCAQTVAKFLNIPLEKIRIKPTDSLISPNAGVTGGAISSELVALAAVGACEQLLAKMKPVKDRMQNPTWEQLVTECYNSHVLLTAHYQDKPGPKVVGYDVWALVCTEVDVDVLTGEFKILRVDLLEDAGMSLSPEVDIGQIEGAFVMGLGLWTTEKLIYDKNTGELLTNNTWEYKVPFAKCIPEDFRVTMMKNRPNPLGVLRSKATGEPPLCLSSSVVFALKYAINSARKDAGNTDWYQLGMSEESQMKNETIHLKSPFLNSLLNLDGPVTPEDIQRLSLTSVAQFDI